MRDVLDKDHRRVALLLREVSAREVGRRYHVTRNAVIGWARDRQVELRPWEEAPNDKGDARRARRHQRQRADVALRARLAGPVLQDRPSRKFNLTSENFPLPLYGMGVPFDRANKMQCQRPLWGDDKYTGKVCGLPVQKGSRYCPECHARFWTTENPTTE